MTYHLVCHRHLFFLYRIDAQEPTLLGSDRHWEPLITLLLDHRVVKLTIFDNWQTHILKIETTSRSLAIHEYIQWCWQKWCHMRQNSLFAMVRPLRRYNGILIAASPSNTQFMPLLEKLDQCAIVSTMYSYPMALILRIHGVYKNQWSPSTPPLLVIIDKESHVLLAFLLKNRLVFVRHQTLASSVENPSMVPKNMIMDTLRYLEKTFEIQGIAPIFFLEDSGLEDTLRGLFPSSVFHFPGLSPTSNDQQTIGESDHRDGAELGLGIPTPFSPTIPTSPGGGVSVSGPSPQAGTFTAGSIFDRLAITQISRAAMMHLQGGILQRSWVKRLVPYIRLINVLAILISIYSMYTALYLMNCNQKLGQRLDQIHQSFKKIQSDLSKMPISSAPILEIQSIRKRSEQQHKDLIQHFSLLEHVLNDRCIIRMMSISPKKTRLSLQTTDPTLVLDDLVDMGQNALSEFQITQAPQSNSSLFVVETTSPFSYEKSSH